MGRGSKGQLFGVFDEQAISLLSVLARKGATFSELLNETRLSRASLFRVLERLEAAGIVGKSGQGYAGTHRGRQILKLVLSIAETHSLRMNANLELRMSEMEQGYLRDHRIFHADTKWERTSEKPLAEVMAMRNMTGTESLLFHQRFQGEVGREERRLRHSTSEERQKT